MIDEAKSILERACPGVVSCADTLAFAARDSAYFLSRSRINYAIPSGRFDGNVSLESEALEFLPPPSFNLSQLVASFEAKKLDADDLVVLSGAHTIGVSHCSSFTDRLPPNNTSDMNPRLATLLQGQCPANPNFTDDTVVQDVVTPKLMDSQYYRNVLKKDVLFRYDAALLESRRTARKVLQNAFVRGRWERGSLRRPWSRCPGSSSRPPPMARSGECAGSTTANWVAACRLAISLKLTVDRTCTLLLPFRFLLQFSVMFCIAVVLVD